MAKKRTFTLDFFQKQGAIGGKVGGVKCWEGVSAAERSERAKKAVAARKWHPVKPKEDEEPPAPAPAPKKRKPAPRKNKNSAGSASLGEI